VVVFVHKIVKVVVFEILLLNSCVRNSKEASCGKTKCFLLFVAFLKLIIPV